MENASKALLIAGAVLIVILIIGVGMAIFNAGQGGIDTAISQMSAQEQQIFNSQFTAYEGQQKGSKLKTLINTVISNNAQEDLPDVSVNGKTSAADLTDIREALSSSTTYIVTITTSNGLVTAISW